jgi:MoxR-like ATPase
METQIIDQNRHVLDRLLNLVRDVLTPEVARAIVDLRADAATQSRIEDLAERHHEGQLSPEELAEYQALVNGVSLISVLQAKARSVLKAQKPS